MDITIKCEEGISEVSGCKMTELASPPKRSMHKVTGLGSLRLYCSLASVSLKPALAEEDARARAIVQWVGYMLTQI